MSVTDILRVDPLSAEDRRLMDEYVMLGRPTDDLPYSPAFDDLAEELRRLGDIRSPSEIINRLFNLRKMGVLPRVGYTAGRGDDVPASDAQLAKELFRKHHDKFVSRDRLPYSPAFDTLHSAFNEFAERPLNKHQFWRLIARVSK